MRATRLKFQFQLHALILAEQPRCRAHATTIVRLTNAIRDATA